MPSFCFPTARGPLGHVCIHRYINIAFDEPQLDGASRRRLLRREEHPPNTCTSRLTAEVAAGVGAMMRTVADAPVMYRCQMLHDYAHAAGAAEIAGFLPSVEILRWRRDVGPMLYIALVKPII